MDEATFGEVRDAVRRFVREKVLPREDEIEETDAIPADLRAAAADLGLFGYALPAEYGGSGVSMAQDVRLAFEFGYATPAFRSMFGTNNGIAGQVIAKFGSDAQKKAFLPALAAGEMVASFALTEPRPGPARPACGRPPAATALARLAMAGCCPAPSGSSPTRRWPT